MTAHVIYTCWMALARLSNDKVSNLDIVPTIEEKIALLR